MNEFRLVIPGEPVAKARPKLGIVNGHAHAFTPKRTRQYDSIVREQAVRQWADRKMLQDVAITLLVNVYRGIPASWSKKRQQAARAGIARPIGKPDWDNFGKAISDGCNGVIYLDDALIVDAHVRKWYADEPRVEVTLHWPESDEAVATPPAELLLEPTLSVDQVRRRFAEDLDAKPF